MFYGLAVALSTVQLLNDEMEVFRRLEIDPGSKPSLMNRLKRIDMDTHFDGFGPARRGSIYLSWNPPAKRVA